MLFEVYSNDKLRNEKSSNVKSPTDNLPSKDDINEKCININKIRNENNFYKKLISEDFPKDKSLNENRLMINTLLITYLLKRIVIRNAPNDESIHKQLVSEDYLNDNLLNEKQSNNKCPIEKNSSKKGLNENCVYFKNH